MSPLVILCAMVGFATVVGLILALVLRPGLTAKRTESFNAVCAEVGFTPLRGPSDLYVACGGEVRGRRLMIQRVETRNASTPLPPRLDVAAEAGLALTDGGGVLIRPGKSPDIGGSLAHRATITAALTPEVLAAVESRLGGRFAFSSWDSLSAEAPSRMMVKSRWPTDWSGLRIQTWVDLDAPPATIQAAMEGLVDVRDALARAPGVTPR